MEILFIILFVMTSQLIHSVAVDQQQGFNPYPFGTTIFCILLHPLLLLSSIFYLGWFWGIVFFLCHFLGLLHGTVAWILNLPELLTKNHEKFFSILKLKIALLAPAILTNLIFTVVSFFVADYKSVFTFLKGNTTAIIVIAIIVAVLSVLRIVVAKQVAKLDD